MDYDVHALPFDLILIGCIFKGINKHKLQQQWRRIENQGVVICVVAVVQSPKGMNNNNNGGELKTSNRAMIALCQGSDHQKLCHEVLSSLNSTNPMEYIATVVRTSMDNMIKAFSMSDRLTVEHGNSSAGMKMALEDCKDLL
ncbi:hypothetical protein JHK87_053512 [Glycine soja]|nr:hypothetical protein JHK87_053512 [Glycine soja]